MLKGWFLNTDISNFLTARQISFLSCMLWCFLAVLRRRQWHPTPVLLSGKSHGRRSLVGCSPWVAKSRTRLSDFTFTFHFHALEKEMATHSSVLAWRIPRMAEPGGLLSMGLHRVRHDWRHLAVAAATSFLFYLLTPFCSIKETSVKPRQDGSLGY